jgi:hypothetical protein
MSDGLLVSSNDLDPKLLSPSYCTVDILVS